MYISPFSWRFSAAGKYSHDQELVHMFEYIIVSSSLQFQQNMNPTRYNQHLNRFHTYFLVNHMDFRHAFCNFQM
ncbi:hypothetical protein pb186bvf_016703 [Paramecium bursaria]